jgi:hypothetical protein
VPCCLSPLLFRDSALEGDARKFRRRRPGAASAGGGVGGGSERAPAALRAGDGVLDEDELQLEMDSLHAQRKAAGYRDSKSSRANGDSVVQLSGASPARHSRSRVRSAAPRGMSAFVCRCVTPPACRGGYDADDGL